MRQGDFITSDLHFGHQFMSEYRGFSSTEEMDAVLVQRWVSKVPPKATVYVLGDISFHRPTMTLEILKQLTGRLHLVKGNHDKNNLNSTVLKKFVWVKDRYASRMEDGRKIVMDHFPLMTWEKAERGWLHCHGHSHGNLIDTGEPRIDVGIDTTEDYAPIDFGELMQRFEGRVYITKYQHTWCAGSTKSKR